VTSDWASTMGPQKKAWLVVLLNLVPLVGVVDSIPNAIPLYNLFAITCFLPILLCLPPYLALVV
jgi:hypothetical protein